MCAWDSNRVEFLGRYFSRRYHRLVWSGHQSSGLNQLTEADLVLRNYESSQFESIEPLGPLIGQLSHLAMPTISSKTPLER